MRMGKSRDPEDRPPIHQKKKMNMWYPIIGVILIIVAAFVLASPKPTYEPLLPATDHVKGSGPIEIVEYSDFQCPACGSEFPHLKEFIDQYGDQAQLTYKHFPLTSIHVFAFKAAEASECAADQDMFWEYHDTLFENQGALADPDLKLYAEQLGLNTELFNACLDSGVMASRVTADFDEGVGRGVGSTPTLFIDGVQHAGVRTVDQLVDITGVE